MAENTTKEAVEEMERRFNKKDKAITLQKRIDLFGSEENYLKNIEESVGHGESIILEAARHDINASISGHSHADALEKIEWLLPMARKFLMIKKALQ